MNSDSNGPGDLYPVHEVFASIQGEGLFVGEPQVFVRLEGCPLRCRWCDTPQTWGLPGEARRGTDWSGERVRSWLTAAQVADRIHALDPADRRAVSLTGGEPLMWPGFVEALRAQLPAARLHLETAGAFPRSLERVLPHLEHVSADLKLPADLEEPVPLAGSLGPFEETPRNEDDWTHARRSVLSLLAGQKACVKLIVAGGHSPGAYAPLLDDVRDFAPGLPLFLQAATPRRDVGAPAPETLESLTELAQSRGLIVRVLPQVHVLLGLR